MCLRLCLKRAGCAFSEEQKLSVQCPACDYAARAVTSLQIWSRAVCVLVFCLVKIACLLFSPRAHAQETTDRPRKLPRQLTSALISGWISKCARFTQVRLRGPSQNDFPGPPEVHIARPCNGRFRFFSRASVAAQHARALVRLLAVVLQDIPRFISRIIGWPCQGDLTGLLARTQMPCQ